MPAAILDAPATMPEYVNTVYPQMRVTLTLIREGNQQSGKKILPNYREITFTPRKVGMKEEGQRQVPIIHGFYTPVDEEERVALQRECDRGYCPAKPVNARLKAAYDAMAEEEAEQRAAHAGRPATRGQA